jgi:hypothetical protein
MTTIVRSGNIASEIKLAPIYPETELTLVIYSQSRIVIVENHELIGIFYHPIMKIVKAIRKIYPMIKMNVI